MLSILIAWSIGRSGSIRHRTLIAFAAATLFGASLEWYQLSVPGRFGSVSDIMLNTLGAVLGVAIAALLF